MKKIALFLALLLALTLLAGCGKTHEHVWKDATCEEPETCTVCGETRGEALGHRWRAGSCTEPEVCARCGKTQGTPAGHDWQEASCEHPETCRRCGETRGEALGHDGQAATCTEPATCRRCGKTGDAALGHDALPADYWSESVCSRCGTVLAPKLTPDFVTYGLDARFIQQDVTYDYVTICYNQQELETVAHARVTDYQIISSNADLPAKEGYEWRIVSLEVVFDDDNAYEYGMMVGTSHENYYNVREHDDTLVYGSDFDSFDVTYKGVTYSCLMAEDSGFEGWEGHSDTWRGTYAFRVPVGYDGMVIGLRNRGVSWPDGAYCFDLDNSDTLYFRLN